MTDNAEAEPWIWTSGPVRCGERRILVACVVNPSAEDFYYGVAGFVERYDRGTWSPWATFAAGLDFWDSVGNITEPNTRMFVKKIGLNSPPGGVGSGEYISISDLEPGLYRLGRRESRFGTDGPGRQALGEFTVTEPIPGECPTVEIPSPVGVLLLTPFLLSAEGGRVGVDRQEPRRPDGGFVSTPDSRAAFAAGLDDTLRVERWSGRSWTRPVHSVPIQTVPVPEFGNTTCFVDLPRMEPGAYRFRCDHATGSMDRVAWVVERPGPL